MPAAVFKNKPTNRIPMEYANQLSEYAPAQSAAEVDERVAQIRKLAERNHNTEVYKFCYSAIDITTLSCNDSVTSVTEFARKTAEFYGKYPHIPNVASICIYPSFVETVGLAIDGTPMRITSVAGGFPAAQTFLEVKALEVAMAIENGADEIDIVFNLGYYFDNDYESVVDEITEQKEATRDGRLKVILETGALKTAKNIKNASVLSLYSGADFLKTSTGKEYPGASLDAAYIMALCIKEYYEKTGNKVGFKASGGVSTTEDAVKYYTIIKEVLGEEWLTTEYFRIGASRLANNLLTSIAGHEVKHF